MFFKLGYFIEILSLTKNGNVVKFSFPLGLLVIFMAFQCKQKAHPRGKGNRTEDQDYATEKLL